MHPFHHFSRPCARPTARVVSAPARSRARALPLRRHTQVTSRRAAVPPRNGSENGDFDGRKDDGENDDETPPPQTRRESSPSPRDPTARAQSAGKENDGNGRKGNETAPPPHPRRNRPSSRDTARALEALRGQADKKIGAEYGEGFVRLKPTGVEERVDVDDLNSRLAPSGALRLRRSLLAPDEAHAALFSFEGVIADTRSAQAAAWTAVAAERGLPWPPREATGLSPPPPPPPPPSSSSSSSSSSSLSSEETSFSISIPPRVALVCSLRPERAITEVLQWTQDWGLASRIAADVAHRYVDIVRDDGFCSARPGVAKWLSALQSAKVPAAVVTSLDRQTLLAALERMGLIPSSSSSSSPSSSSAFSSFVTAEDGAESLAHSLLAAALKLARPPNACCAFVSSPAGVAAAHNASMRAVAVLQGGDGYGAHELRSADATVARLDELRVIQLRRLFANGVGGSGVGEGDVGGMPRQKERVDKGGGGNTDGKDWRGSRARPRGVAGGLIDRREEERGDGGRRRR